MGESPSNCSFHLRQLAKYGFVEEAEGGTGRQRPWRTVNVGMRFTDVQEDADTALARVVQERVYSAVEVLVGVPQMVSIAAGALLVTLVDYRLLLLLEATVVAAAGAWLLLRARRGVSASL